MSCQALVRAPSSRISQPRASRPALMLFDPEARLKAWIDSLSGHPPIRCGVVHPCDESALHGALDAFRAGLIEPVIIAPKARVSALSEKFELSLEGIELIDTPHSHAPAAQAAAMAARRELAMLMKGSLHTDELMEAVLAEAALRTGRRMLHVFRFEVPTYERPLLITDAAINIAPTLAEKADILQNVIDLAHALGIHRPNVALLSAVETVTPKIPSTLDAAALCKMADRGQIEGALLDGPLAFDNAISAAAAASCGIVLGAQVPIVLTSRADSALSRVASAALAGVMQRAPRPGKIEH